MGDTDNLNVTPPSCEKTCMAVNALSAADTSACESYAEKAACTQHFPTCVWKSACTQGHCYTPSTLYMYPSPSANNTDLLTMSDSPPPVGTDSSSVTQYGQCQTATPSLCATYPSATPDPSSTGGNTMTFGEDSGRNQENCEGCAMYARLQQCGAQLRPPPTGAPGATQPGGYQLVFDKNTRPCECEPYINPETGEIDDTQDGTGVADCCGNGEMWFVGGEACLDPGSSHKSTLAQVEAACNAKAACTWSQNMKRCVAKACPQRATSKQCQKAVRGQDTEKGLKQCAWIGKIGGHGHCIHGNCYDRCNERDCTSVVEDSRVSVHGGCAWVEDAQDAGLPANPSCAAANALAEKQLGVESVRSRGVCMPLECTERGKFQPSDLKYTPPADNKPAAEGTLAKTIAMQQKMQERGEKSCTLTRSAEPGAVSVPACYNVCTGIESKYNNACKTKNKNDCEYDDTCTWKETLCSENEMCVWKKGARACIPRRVPQCRWSPEAPNPLKQICSAVSSLSTQSPQDADNYQNSTWFLRSLMSSKGMCVEDTVSSSQSLHNLDKSTPTPKKSDTIHHAYKRSVNYENNCLCSFAPLGFCEQFEGFAVQGEERSCPLDECMLVGVDGEQRCTSRAFEYCQEQCGIMYPESSYMCPPGSYGKQDQSAVNPTSWASPQDVSGEEAQSCAARKKPECTYPCQWEGGSGGTGRCSVIPKYLAAETLACPAAQERGCFKHHSATQFQETTCAANVTYETCQEPCTWIDEPGAERCTGVVPPRLVNRSPVPCYAQGVDRSKQHNLCLQTCMRDPARYCQGACNLTSCTGACHREHMGSPVLQVDAAP